MSETIRSAGAEPLIDGLGRDDLAEAVKKGLESSFLNEGQRCPAEDRLERLLELEEDWDSYDAAPVNPAAVSYARSILRAMSVIPGVEDPETVTATPNGFVALAWRNGVEMEVDGSGEVTGLFHVRQFTGLVAHWQR